MKSTIQGQSMDVEDPPIPENIAERLVKEKAAYLRAKEEFEDNFDSDNETQYYVLSSKFIKEWKKYTAYDQKHLTVKPKFGAAPQPYNKNLLVADSDGLLKPGLLEMQDYRIVSAKMMDVFAAYKGQKIQKTAHKLRNGKKIVEIYGLEFQYFFISQKIVGNLDGGSRSYDLILRKAQISRYVTLKEMKKGCLKQYDEIERGTSAKDVRIWKLDSNTTVKKFQEYIKKTVSSQIRDLYRLKNTQASLMDKEDYIIEDLALAVDDILIVEILEHGKEWVIASEATEDQCEFCRKYKILKVQCGCKKVSYCSDECKIKDLSYHRRKCNLADEEELKEDISFAFTKNSRRGQTGLSNLGNTCFMNSCLQCLSNSTALTEYFITKSYVNQINKTNPIGTKGKLTVKYAKMIQGLWCQADDVYSPYSLKSAISDFQPMFSGYNQHDSQELLSFLLDGLHEDLNRVINKPYVESIDYKGEAEEVYAFESWKRYLMRNRSIIVDLFMGQYKSKVVCPDCKFESITFDPFSTVSLPIPQSSRFSLDVFVFFSNYREVPKKLTIDSTVKSIKTWKEEVAKTLSLDPNNTNFYVLSFDGEAEEFNNDSNPDRLISHCAGKTEMFLVEYSKEEREDLKNSVLVYTKFTKVVQSFMGRTEIDSFTFKRPFYWKSNKLMGHQMYFRIFTFLYKVCLSIALKYPQNATESKQMLVKYFEKAFAESSKGPFQIYLLSEPKKQKSDIVHQKQTLIQFNTPVHQMLFQANGQLRKIQFEVRLRKDIREETKKLNTYEDYDKYKKNKMEEDNTEYSLEDCLREFERTEKLEVGNEWRCPKCKDFKLAYKSMSLYKTPKILILHLKRFKAKSSYAKSKIGSLIKFPSELSLDGYVINKTLPEAYFKGETPNVNTKQSTKYELYAVSNHYGGLGGGHYTAYAKNNGEWYDFNDSHVHKVRSGEVISSAAYMLFYKRID